MTRLVSLRLLLAASAASITLAVAAVASADPATVVLPGGEEITGEVADIVVGDHVGLKLPNGQLKTIPWASLVNVQIGGTIVIGGASPAPAAPPPAPTMIAPPPPPAAPPPALMNEPPPPATAYAPPPPPPVAHFVPRWTLGGRVGIVSPGKDSALVGNPSTDTSAIRMSDYAKGGISVEADFGYHFSPSWTIYGFWEHGFLSKGDANQGASSNPSTDFLGLGMNANTNPEGVGFYFDVALGYRWMSVPYGTGTMLMNASSADFGSGEGTAHFRGFEALRLAFGLSIVASPTTRWDLALSGSAGNFSHVDSDGRVCAAVAGADCSQIPQDKQAMHAFGGLTLSAHFGL